MKISSLFKKRTKKQQNDLSSEQKDELNPYLCARKNWNSHVGSIMSEKIMWQVISIIALLITFYSVSGIISIGSESKYIPYIVEKDITTGSVSAGGVVYPSKLTSADKVIFQAAASDYIFHSRMVTADAAMQRKSIFKVYSMLTDLDPAFSQMNEWMRLEGKTPFDRATKELVSVEIKSALPQTGDTWQIEWIETVRDRQGSLIGSPMTMRALVSLYQAEIKSKRTLEEINNNPLNIYVREFSWSKLN